MKGINVARLGVQRGITAFNALQSVLENTRYSCLVAVMAWGMAGCSGGDSHPDAAESENRSSQGTTISDTVDAGNSAESDNSGLPSAGETDQLDDHYDENPPAIVEAPYFREADYAYVVNLPLQFITTGSGKKLSVRVTLPANEKGVPAPGPFPVILTQSGYNTNLLSYMFLGMPGNLMLGAPDPFMVKRGYAQVAVDALGTGASEGGWELFGEEEQLGFADAVDWAHQQPWANGKLGVAGVSYMAISSLFAAQHRPDSIHAVFASLPRGTPCAASSAPAVCLMACS